jgi:hypothetical protein
MRIIGQTRVSRTMAQSMVLYSDYANRESSVFRVSNVSGVNRSCPLSSALALKTETVETRNIEVHGMADRPGSEC